MGKYSIHSQFVSALCLIQLLYAFSSFLKNRKVLCICNGVFKFSIMQKKTSESISNVGTYLLYMGKSVSSIDEQMPKKFQ